MAITENPASENADIIGREDINDLEAILAVTNTERDATVSHVKSHFDTIFTWDYEKGHRPKLNRLYEKAKTSMWNGETDLPWDTVVDQEETVRQNAIANSTGLNQGMDLAGTPFAKWGDKEWLQVASSRRTGRCRSSCTASRARSSAPLASSRTCRGSSPSTTPRRR